MDREPEAAPFALFLSALSRLLYNAGGHLSRRLKTCAGERNPKTRPGISPVPVSCHKSGKGAIFFLRALAFSEKRAIMVLLKQADPGMSSGSAAKHLGKSAVSASDGKESAGHGLRAGCRPDSAFRFPGGPTICRAAGGRGETADFAAVVPYARAR